MQVNEYQYHNLMMKTFRFNDNIHCFSLQGKCRETINNYLSLHLGACLWTSYLHWSQENFSYPLFSMVLKLKKIGLFLFLFIELTLSLHPVNDIFHQANEMKAYMAKKYYSRKTFYHFWYHFLYSAYHGIMYTFHLLRHICIFFKIFLKRGSFDK